MIEYRHRRLMALLLTIQLLYLSDANKLNNDVLLHDNSNPKEQSHEYLRSSTQRHLPAEDSFTSNMKDWNAAQTGVASGLFFLIIFVLILYCCCGCSLCDLLALWCCWEICCDGTVPYWQLDVVASVKYHFRVPMWILWLPLHYRIRTYQAVIMSSHVVRNVWTWKYSWIRFPFGATWKLCLDTSIFIASLRSLWTTKWKPLKGSLLDRT